MLKSVTEKSYNNLNNQEVNQSSASQNSDTTLFDQFSDILDKIATSLNRAKQSSKEQNIQDISTMLSQAAPQHLAQRQQQQPAQVQEKRATESSVKNEEQTKAQVSDTETTQATKTEGKQELQKAECPAENKQETKKTDTESTDKNETEADTETIDSETVESGNRQLNFSEEQVVEATEVVSEEQESEQNVSEVSANIQNSDEVAEETTETVSVVDAADLQPVQATPAESTTPAANKAVTAIDTQDAQITATKAAPKSQSAEETQVEAQTAEVTAPENQELNIEAVRVSSDFKSKDTIRAAELKTQEILVQSAQELLRQALLTTPVKSIIDTQMTQKLLSSAQGIQSVNNTTSTNNQNLNTPFGQIVKAARSTQEKQPARELTRLASTRAMERVESALKEVAKSKDGKTISLRLDPPSLGSVKIDVTLKDGNLHARIVAESPQITALLREHSHELQQVLRSAGIDADKISVSVGSEQLTDNEVNGGLNFFEQQFSQESNESSRKGKAATGNSELFNQNTAAPQTKTVLDHWVA